MKAITLYQPWATLMAIGAKRVETRSKPWKYVGLVAIHAGYRGPADLPLGKVVAIGKKIACVATEILTSDSDYLRIHPPLTPQERAFGDYGPGRFGWLFSEARKLPDPIPFFGKRGCWDLPAAWCDLCDGVGVMEGWAARDGWSCPRCHGNALVLEQKKGVGHGL